MVEMNEAATILRYSGEKSFVILTKLEEEQALMMV